MDYLFCTDSISHMQERPSSRLVLLEQTKEGVVTLDTYTSGPAASPSAERGPLLLSTEASGDDTSLRCSCFLA